MEEHRPSPCRSSGSVRSLLLRRSTAGPLLWILASRGESGDAIRGILRRSAGSAGNPASEGGTPRDGTLHECIHPTRELPDLRPKDGDLLGVRLLPLRDRLGHRTREPALDLLSEEGRIFGDAIFSRSGHRGM